MSTERIRMKRVCFVLFLCLCYCEARVKLRLAGGKHYYEGRVEVFVNGKWAVISAQSWGKKAGQVVCRQLGFGGKIIRYSQGTVYGHPSRPVPVYLEMIKCQGTETHIDDCTHSGWVKPRRRLSFYNLAGVMCFTEVGQFLRPNVSSTWSGFKSSQIEISLDGTVENGIVSAGYFRISYKGNIGYVCAQSWKENLGNMRVACGELGFPNASEMVAKQSNQNIILSRLACNGSESSILSCKQFGFTVQGQSCQNNEVVWLNCTLGNRTSRSKNSALLKLRGAAYPWAGRIELKFRHGWANLCDDKYNLLTANVICRTLGYGTAKEANFAAKYGQGTQLNVVEEVSCDGDETDIKQCRWSVLKKSKCTHFEDAGVECNVPKYQLREVRLAGGNTSSEGRVEVKINGQWGTVCGDAWFVKSAMIVCRELGLNFAKANITGDKYGVGAKMVMSKPICIGDELSLTQCLRDDQVTCSSTDNFAAVQCTDALPDLALSIRDIYRTLRVNFLPNEMLQCSFEENCLDSSAKIYMREEYITYYKRRLMRFSSLILNFGSADYRPYAKKEDWIWHSCHKHFHSEEEFATYDLLSADGARKKIAEGHKASFCLEDTSCLPGIDRKYNCTSGIQGISMNCYDDYAYNIDCQWIDVTTVDYPRSYIFQVNINPNLIVPETDFDNNVVICDIFDRGSSIRVRHCGYDYCTSGLRSHGGNANKACCVFPFYFKGVWYDTCTKSGFSKYWCSTTTIYEGNFKWGLC